MRNIIPVLLLFFWAVLPTTAEDLLRDDPPARYLVKTGDTLWDISARFLRTPWRWPEVWGMNKEQIDDPHWIFPGDVIRLDRSGATPRLLLERVAKGQQSRRLSPQIRELAIDAQAISSIPAAAIEPFLSQPLLVESAAFERAPRIIATEDSRVIIGAGNIAYVDGLSETDERDWQVYRAGKALRDPDSGEILGFEAIYLGDARVKKYGNPSTIEILRSKLEINAGDLMMTANEEIFIAYVPHAPGQKMQGRIVSAYNGVSEVAQNSIVTLNRGKRDGLEIGHVLATYRDGETVRSATNRKRYVKLPDERVGLVFVFRTFDRLSYALVMQSTRPIHLNDVVQTP